jgi:hypothetical protein
MAKYDRISTIFFVGFALAICVESIRIGPGSLSNPGPGLIPRDPEPHRFMSDF